MEHRLHCFGPSNLQLPAMECPALWNKTIEAPASHTLLRKFSWVWVLERNTFPPEKVCNAQRGVRTRTDRTWRLSICCFPAQQDPIYNSGIPRSEPSFAIIAHVVHTHVCSHCTPGDEEALPPTFLATHLACDPSVE